ncbi:MAG: hypothetical protein A2538_02530 [Candidatus Magasanikbacteria bacterium RIFOXYD2_FULL_41_14]|uniref:Nudix hydrolase domain-containing protein n=1 Tax=Candidatus Magasanikbacteria bacterium RIFOXYD2_FULL_41_14 TaxID=1798709 RepID=A0A1F6PC43_9BACT|nr:MAG: hypothetical protein A2538_02530 [Candidatus Magasanikbacteria bacterium RIFOXYD2_FULL_41_14]
MPAQIGKTENGNALHYSVGAIIKLQGKYLLIDRAIKPSGFAVLAGHINDGETTEHALAREVEEEGGLGIASAKLVWQGEVENNWCSRGIGIHYWNVFECETTGDPMLFTAEAKSIGLYTIEEMKKMPFDPAVLYWMKKLHIL